MRPLLAAALVAALVAAGCTTGPPRESQPGDAGGSGGGDAGGDADASLAPCPDFSPPADAPPGRHPFCFVTPDGWEVRGAAVDGRNESGPLVVLVHGWAQDRGDWGSIREDILQFSRGVMLFDLRGHGASVERDGETRDFNALTRSDLLKMDAEVAGAVAEGSERYGNATPVVLMGASIGANLAIRYAADHPENATAVVALSPGLRFGVPLGDAHLRYDGDLLLVASEHEAHSAESAREIARESPADADVKVWEREGHGTGLLWTAARDHYLRWLREDGLEA